MQQNGLPVPERLNMAILEELREKSFCLTGEPAVFAEGGLKPGVPETWNISHPDIVVKLQRLSGSRL